MHLADTNRDLKVVWASTTLEREWLGTAHRVPLRDTAGVVRTAELIVVDACHLGCGCYRLYAERPGPKPGEDGYSGISTEVQFLAGGCGLHRDERDRGENRG